MHMGMFSIRGSPFPFGDYRTEMGRETRIFPYEESPFLNRVCFHLGINIYLRSHPLKFSSIWFVILIIYLVCYHHRSKFFVMMVHVILPVAIHRPTLDKAIATEQILF
jgi:hypothetical protein